MLCDPPRTDTCREMVCGIRVPRDGGEIIIVFSSSFSSLLSAYLRSRIVQLLTMPSIHCSYANSVLQALYFCGPFRDLVVQYPDPSSPDVPVPLMLPGPSVAVPTSPLSKSKPTRRPSVSDAHTVSSPQPCSVPGPSTPSPLPIPASPPTLLSALRSLYIHISRNPADRGTVAPRAFIDKLKELNELFRSTMHQDAHEFLNYLLNQIVEEIGQDRKKAASHHNGSLSPSGEDRKSVISY